jgi:hypothetical protein
MDHSLTTRGLVGASWAFSKERSASLRCDGGAGGWPLNKAILLKGLTSLPFLVLPGYWKIIMSDNLMVYRGVERFGNLPRSVEILSGVLARTSFRRRVRRRAAESKQRDYHDTVRLMERHLRELASLRERWSTILTLQEEARKREELEAARREEERRRAEAARYSTSTRGKRRDEGGQFIAPTSIHSRGRSKPAEGGKRGRGKAGSSAPTRAVPPRPVASSSRGRAIPGPVVIRAPTADSEGFSLTTRGQTRYCNAACRMFPARCTHVQVAESSDDSESD